MNGHDTLLAIGCRARSSLEVSSSGSLRWSAATAGLGAALDRGRGLCGAANLALDRFYQRLAGDVERQQFQESFCRHVGHVGRDGAWSPDEHMQIGMASGLELELVLTCIGRRQPRVIDDQIGLVPERAVVIRV